MTAKRLLLGVSGVTALCCALVVVDKAVGPVLRRTLRPLLPQRQSRGTQTQTA